jgi:hypothetical protein
MKTNEFQDLPRSYWETLDTLVDGGWEPLINWLKAEGRWHVNLSHHTAPVPVVYVDLDSGTQHYNPHRYRKHGYGATLAEALDEAFKQVLHLIEPAPPQTPTI